MSVLVTTAFKNNSDIDLDILYLGEWCKKNLTESDLHNDTSSTVPYYWNDREKFYQDYKYISDLIENKIYPAITIELNRVHNVNYSNRYWEIVLGPWLLSLVTCLLDRWNMIMFASRECDIDYVLLDNDCENIVPYDTLDFKELRREDTWNNYVYSIIIDRWTSLKSANMALSDPIENNKLKLKLKLKSKIKYFLYGLYNLASFFSRNNSIVFFDSYMSKVKQWKIEFLLGQTPSTRYSNIRPNVHIPIDLKLRQEVSFKFESNSEFELFVMSMLSKQLPVVFLEGYSYLVRKSNGYLFPKYPKIIFTSNAHLANDIFNIWSARSVEHNAKLIIAQHGGGYGSHKYSIHEDHEKKISEYFLTWGWSNAGKPYTSFLMTKQFVKYEKFNFKRKKGLLHILYSFDRYATYLESTPCSSQYIEYIYNQNLFINNINHSLVQGYTVRKHPNAKDWGLLDKINFQGFNISFDSNKHFLKSLYSHELIVVTANETVFLQALSSGIPMVAFFDPRLNELNDYVVNDYNDLRSSGIIHDSPESAAKFINNIWGDINAWWRNDQVQSARKQFCNKYAKVSPDASGKWVEFFKKINDK